MAIKGERCVGTGPRACPYGVLVLKKDNHRGLSLRCRFPVCARGQSVGTGRDLSLPERVQRYFERLFMAEAENPGFFGFDDALFFGA